MTGRNICPIFPSSLANGLDPKLLGLLLFAFKGSIGLSYEFKDGSTNNWIENNSRENERFRCNKRLNNWFRFLDIVLSDIVLNYLHSIIYFLRIYCLYFSSNLLINNETKQSDSSSCVCDYKKISTCLSIIKFSQDNAIFPSLSMIF